MWVMALLVGCVGGSEPEAGPGPAGAGPAGAGVRLVMKGEEIPEGGRFLSPDGVEVEIRADGTVIIKKGPDESRAMFEPGQYRAAVGFMQRLQEAMKAGKIEEVAGMMRYPLRVNGGERPVEIKDKAELVARYAEVFTAAVRGKIVAASPWQLFARNGQVMLGDGVIWVDGTGEEMRVASVNP